MTWSAAPGGVAEYHTLGWAGEASSVEPVHGPAWTGLKKVSAPLMAASAAMGVPSARSGVRVELPSSGPALPYELPFPLGPYASMHATGVMPPALMGNGAAVVAAPRMAASGQLQGAPSVSYVVEVPSANVLPVGLPFILGPLASLHASAHMDDPTRVIVANVPVMSATAGMATPTPAVPVGFEVDVPVMLASGASAGTLPYDLPFPLAGPMGMMAPAVVSGSTVSAPRMSATAAVGATTVSAGVAAVVPRMAASASVNVVTGSSGARVTAPRMQASAATPAADRIWTQPPVITPFTAGGTFDVSAIRGWATHLDLITLGGGGAGNGGASGFANGGGGGAGAFGTGTIALADYPGLTALTVTVGAVRAGPSSGSGANGNPSSISGTGITTVTGAGGTGGQGQGVQQNGYGGGSTTYNGNSYGPRGAGGTGNAGAGTAPGAGGAGGTGVFFGTSAGGAGARGQVWICAYRI